jgi:ribosomal protein S18 acetylase RimI-like enzyme
MTEDFIMLRWKEGATPLDLTGTAVKQVLDLFLRETGERYSEASVRHLPIPAWGGNLVLVDSTSASPERILGLLWATPFKDDIVRVAAFAIDTAAQNQGWGSRAWEMFARTAWAHGYRKVQLEVKAENNGAQRFYAARGLTVQTTLEGYYQSGLGYMMQGPLSPPSQPKPYAPR